MMVLSDSEDCDVFEMIFKFIRSETLFKSLLFWLAGEVSWLAVEVLSPCRK